jgi:hypothetical protein
MVKNWRRRWFVLWPASGSKWAQIHADSRWAQTRGTKRTQQLLLYYESADSSTPKGIVPLEPGCFVIQSENGGTYRGEETLVLAVQAKSAVHARYILRSEERGNPGDLPRAHCDWIAPAPCRTACFAVSLVASPAPGWASLILQGTGELVDPEPQSSTKLLEARYYRVDCPQRQKAPHVKDAVVWRKSPDMEDRVTDADSADEELIKGAEDGSVWRAVVETPEWVQAKNVSQFQSRRFACVCLVRLCLSASVSQACTNWVMPPWRCGAGILAAQAVLAADSEPGSRFGRPCAGASSRRASRCRGRSRARPRAGTEAQDGGSSRSNARDYCNGSCCSGQPQQS